MICGFSIISEEDLRPAQFEVSTEASARKAHERTIECGTVGAIKEQAANNFFTRLSWRGEERCFLYLFAKLPLANLPNIETRAQKANQLPSGTYRTS